MVRPYNDLLEETKVLYSANIVTVKKEKENVMTYDQPADRYRKETSVSLQACTRRQN